MKVELIAITKYLRGDGTPEELLEHAGRICYRSESRGDPDKFLRARVREGHESLIEHASATFEISGISRACSHQLVRHRLASFSQESQRYVDMEDPEYVIPPSVEPAIWHAWLSAIDETRQAYATLRDHGVPKEDARFLLPNATKTRLVMTANFREWLHICRLRTSRAAQWEIRRVCTLILEALVDECPAVFEQLYEEIQ